MKRADRDDVIKRTEAALKEERLRTAAVLKGGFDTILVVSDLHLGPGIDVISTRWDRTENFFCDGSFGHALAWVRSRRTAGVALLDWDGSCFTPTQLEWSDAEGKGVECVILMH